MRSSRSDMCASALVAGFLAFGGAGYVYADDQDDSNADSRADFVDLMNGAHGVIVAVPVNEEGQENTDAAVLRAYTGPLSAVEARDVDTMMANSVDIGSRSEVLDPESDSNTDSDSSTYYWRNWYGHGWRNYGYYHNYQPYYRYSNYYWNCGYPNYYGNYYGNYGSYYPNYGYSNYNWYYYPYVY